MFPPVGEMLGPCYFPDTVGAAHFRTNRFIYNTTTEVKADVPATDIMNAGMVQVYVHTGGANSNTMTFTIQ